MVQVGLFDSSGRMVNYGEREISDFEQSKYGEFKITIENGPTYMSHVMKFFSD
jgi:hypothetical protein